MISTTTTRTVIASIPSSVSEVSIGLVFVDSLKQIVELSEVFIAYQYMKINDLIISSENDNKGQKTSTTRC